jgi:hypothetical protein
MVTSPATHRYFHLLEIVVGSSIEIGGRFAPQMISRKNPTGFPPFEPNAE